MIREIFLDHCKCRACNKPYLTNKLFEKWKKVEERLKRVVEERNEEDILNDIAIELNGCFAEYLKEASVQNAEGVYLCRDSVTCTTCNASTSVFRGFIYPLPSYS
jgi:hypothetical protein